MGCQSFLSGSTLRTRRLDARFRAGDGFRGLGVSVQCLGLFWVDFQPQDVGNQAYDNSANGSVMGIPLFRV